MPRSRALQGALHVKAQAFMQQVKQFGKGYDLFFLASGRRHVPSAPWLARVWYDPLLPPEVTGHGPTACQQLSQKVR